MVDSAFYTAPFFIVAVLLGTSVSCCLARRTARELRFLETRVEQLESLAAAAPAAAVAAAVANPAPIPTYIPVLRPQLPPAYNPNAPRAMSYFPASPLQATAPV